MNKFFASFTTLNAWYEQRMDDAINAYFRLANLDDVPAIKEGKEYHQKWEAEIRLTGKTPEVFGAKQLTVPQTELFLSADLAPWLVLRGVIDLVDGDVVYEWKTGGSIDSQSIARTQQVGIYGLLCHLNGMPVKTAQIHHFNQHNKSTDMTIVHLTKQRMLAAADWIESIASDMNHYLEENGLYEKYGRRTR